MKAEILEKLKTLAEQELVLDSLDEFNDLTNEFYRIQEEEEHAWEVKKLERIEAGEKPESIEKPVYPLLNEFKSYSRIFKAKKKVEEDKIKEVEKANLIKKKAILAAFMDLIQNEENIGRAIARYKDIQDGWKEVGPIPRDKRQEIQREFSNLVDTFQYNINIYKDLKDHDLNRNLQLKKDLIEELKGLLSLEKIKEIESELHRIQDEWNNVGGTHQEDWEKIKDEYWETVNAVYDKIKAFYVDRREQQADNIKAKEALIEKAKAITLQDYSAHKDWNKATEDILAVQEEWKTIGFGAKAENDRVWNDFREVCNAFFDSKKEFYDSLTDEYQGVKEEKERLIEAAEALKNETHWKNTTQKIVELQAQWKKLGSAGPKFENKLWKRFRDPIDFFFNAKEAFYNGLDAENQANLDAKNALIEKINAYQQGADTKKTIEDLRAFAAEFAEIGNVPRKVKDAVYANYKKALDDQYASIKMDKAAKQKAMFEAKLDTLAGADNSNDLLEKERRRIRGKIDELKGEIFKYENNLSFFANADENNPLFKSVIQNIENNKAQIEDLKSQLKLIRDKKDE